MVFDMEEDGKLSRKELELIYDVLFKRIMELMDNPEIDQDPFGEMLSRLSVLSGVFSFKGMITLIPELVAYAIRYGMMVEKAYEEEHLHLVEDAQGSDPKHEKAKMAKIQDDIDKLNIYL
jgi:hypothetical protein